MAAFDQLQKWSFDNIKFPVEQYTVSSALRKHVHVYPHSPGGAPEKLGRELYVIKATGNFQTRFEGYGDNLWPGDMADLRDRYENELTSTLVIPTIGSIQAFITNWHQIATSKIRSGEKVEIEWLEDQSSAFLINQLINVKVQNLDDSSTALFSSADDAGLSLGSIGDTISGLINSVTAIGDQVQLYGSLLAAQLDGIATACSNLEATLPDLNQPANWQTRDALHNLWFAAVQSRQDVLRQSTPIVAYTTPTLMSVTDVAKALYGDSSRGGQVLQLNALEDPFHIAANTNLRVYAA